MGIFKEERNSNCIVRTDLKYNYDILNENIRDLTIAYPFMEIGSIGKSVLGKNIPYIRIGRGQKQVLYHASIHANEWITSVLLMKFVENYSKAIKEDEYIYGYRARVIFEICSIYIVPMVNPDGVDLVNDNINKNSEVYKSVRKIANSYPEIPFPSGWKASIRGVDLNLQFPAGWREARRIKFEQGYTKPAPRDFVGERTSYRARSTCNI